MAWDDIFGEWGGGAPEDNIDFSPIESIPDPIFDDPIEQGPGYIDWENWGGGAGGDGTDGSGDFGGGGSLGNVGGLLAKILGAGGGSSGGGIGSILSAITGGNGGLTDILQLAALLGGTANQSNSVKEAADRMEAAAGKANELATSTIGGAQKNYQPYIDAGAGALGKMQNFDTSPLAGKFVSKAPSGKLTLADLARR